MTDMIARTVQKQYANSPVLMALLQLMDQWIDPDAIKADFLDKVWNIDTAAGFGLDIWGRILGQSRYLLKDTTQSNRFGFFGTGLLPFNQAPFYSAVYDAHRPAAMSDRDYRQILLLKAASNIARSDVRSINALLRAAFSSKGSVYVRLYADAPMVATYVFGFAPSYLDNAILAAGLFPVPAGVLLDVEYQAASSTFGFNGTGLQPFNQGTFHA